MIASHRFLSFTYLFVGGLAVVAAVEHMFHVDLSAVELVFLLLTLGTLTLLRSEIDGSAYEDRLDEVPQLQEDDAV